MKIIIFSIIMVCGFLIACQPASESSVSPKPSLTPTLATPSATPVNPLSLGEVKEAFEKAGLPMRNIVVYSDETDPNKLLGRPNQYIEKMNFEDKRNTSGRKACTIEVFKNKEELELRKQYVESMAKAVPFYTQYIYAHKNILLRLESALTPKQAKEYEEVLNSL